MVDGVSHRQYYLCTLHRVFHPNWQILLGTYICITFCLLHIAKIPPAQIHITACFNWSYEAHFFLTSEAHPIIIDSTCLDLGLMFPNINHIFIALSFAYSIYFYSSQKKTYQICRCCRLSAYHETSFTRFPVLGHGPCHLARFFSAFAPHWKCWGKSPWFQGTCFCLERKGEKSFNTQTLNIFRKKKHVTSYFVTQVGL